MNHPLPEEIGKALHKAEEAILHAEHNLEEGYFPVTVNRAY